MIYVWLALRSAWVETPVGDFALRAGDEIYDPYLVFWTRRNGVPLAKA